MHFRKRENQVTSSKMVIKVCQLVHQTRHTTHLAGNCWTAATACRLLPGLGLPLTAEVQAMPSVRCLSQKEIPPPSFLTIQSKFNYPTSKVSSSPYAFHFIQIHFQQLNYRTLIYNVLSQKGRCTVLSGLRTLLSGFQGKFYRHDLTHSWMATATLPPQMRKLNLRKVESVACL